jgi:hypothetical protein
MTGLKNDLLNPSENRRKNPGMLLFADKITRCFSGHLNSKNRRLVPGKISEVYL